MKQIAQYVTLTYTTNTISHVEDTLERLVDRITTAIEKENNTEVGAILKTMQEMPRVASGLVIIRGILFNTSQKGRVHVNKKTLHEYLETLRKLFNFWKLHKHTLPFPLINRKVIKQLVMPDGYNAGNPARIEALFKYYKDTYCAMGYSTIPKEDITLISNIINILYVDTSRQMLHGVTQFKVLVREFVTYWLDKEKGITIRMPNLTWELHKYSQNTSTDKRCRVPLKGFKFFGCPRKFYSFPHIYKNLKSR